MKEKKPVLSIVQQVGHKEQLSTKTMAPELYEGLVNRGRVMAEFDGAIKPGSTLITAPAGYGKTVAMAQWLRHSQMPFAWFKLDPSDNNPHDFVCYFAGSLNTIIPGTWEYIRSLDGQSLLDDWQRNTEVLLEKMKNHAQPAVLVLDDVHTVQNPQVIDLLLRLIKAIDGNHLRLLLSGRYIPENISAVELQSHGLRSMDTQVLRFNRDEILQFIEGFHYKVSQEQVDYLEERTEGWVGGLDLTLRALQHRNDWADITDLFLDRTNSISNYMQREVFSRWDEGVQSFLLETSILDRLTAPSCQAVTGREDSQVILEQLSPDNHLVITLNKKRRIYRYNHLFHLFLKHKLQSSDRSRMSGLYQAAASYYEQHCYNEQAVGYYLKGHHYQQALVLIEKLTPTMLLSENQRFTLGKWMSKIPESSLEQQGTSLISAGWVHLMNGHKTDADRVIHKSEQWINANRDKAVYRKTVRQCDVELCFLKSFRAFLDGHFETASEQLHQMLKNKEYNTSYTVVLEDLFQKNQELSLLGSRFGYYGQLRLLQDEAGWLFDRLHPFVEEIGCAGKILQAEIFYETCDLDGAENLAVKAMEEASENQVWGLYSSAVYLLVKIMNAQGSSKEATWMLEEAAGLLREMKLEQLTCYMEGLKAWIDLQSGQMDIALAWNDSCGLTLCYQMEKFNHYLHSIHIRIQLMQRNLAMARLEVEQLLCHAEKEGRIMHKVEALNLMAVVYYMSGAKDAAVSYLERSVSIGYEQGYQRTFIDEGKLLLPVLRMLHRKLNQETTRSDSLRHYTDDLIRSATRYVKSCQTGLNEGGGLGTARLIEPLTAREVQILQCLARNMTNTEIAESLHIQLTTVKAHARNIYGKLGVANRTQAVVFAREHKII